MQGFRPAGHRAFGGGARARRPAVITHCMRDQHRPKQDLINEVIGLRKQVADLREAMTARRRVEDALRESERQLRALADAAPVGLCLLRRDGRLFAANRPFARLLGYETAAELLRVGDTLGIFGSPEEVGRVLALVERGLERTAGVVFRRKDGARQAFGVIGAASLDTLALAVVSVPSPAERAAHDLRVTLR
jgi:PAS domain S-box-containing protein